MFRKDPVNVALDDAITNLLSEMAGYDGDSKEYKKQTERLVELIALRKGNQISKEAILTASVHILGIAIIVGHERANVITSKAVTFLSKLF